MSLDNLADTLAIDLPGCGMSSFEPKDWKAYTTGALAALLASVIDAHRDHEAGQGVVLIAHSMGCSLSALLASKTSPHASLISDHIFGLVAICPQAEPPDEKHAKAAKWVTSIPAPIFDLMRKYDRRGGINSKSVLRMAGQNAENETKRLQLRFNKQSRTPVWQRMAYGALVDVTDKSGLPGEEVWKGLKLPVFLIAGEADAITPWDNVRKIAKFLGRDVASMNGPSEKASLPIAAAPVDPAILGDQITEKKHQDSGVDANDLPKVDDEAKSSGTSLESQTVISTEAESIAEDAITVTATSTLASGPAPHPRRLIVKTTVFPKPASHALLYAPSTSRILSGLIGTFLSDHVDPRLSLGWQLQYLTTEGKWDVKNFKKWQAVQAVSLPIAKTFRAMKTLREVDEEHSPKQFVKKYAGQVHSVVDISHDSPVYDPKGLEDGGIRYYKFPTVSKLPPTSQEASEFIALIDQVHDENRGKEGLLGVHCHYGFNRTGFFLVCYMVERLGYRVEEAIDEFAAKRAPGIRHAHFIDALHVKYCVGLQRAPTL
jgi:pimeloyl-ACP methyl ester carboxylesterase/protein-tyrosine phosphatase